MIKLQIEKYCHNCPEFEAQVDKTYFLYLTDPEIHTIVTCEHRGKCECIRKYFEDEQEKGERK